MHILPLLEDIIKGMFTHISDKHSAVVLYIPAVKE